MYQQSSQPLSLCTCPRKGECWRLDQAGICPAVHLTARGSAPEAAQHLAGQRALNSAVASPCLRARVFGAGFASSTRSVLGGASTRASFYFPEPQQLRLSALTLQVVKELRAAGWLWRQGEALGKGRHAVPTGRVLLSPEAVCNSKTNTSMLWVPSWYDSNPIPLGV